MRSGELLARVNDRKGEGCVHTAKRILKTADSLVSIVAALLLMIAGAYSAYALWDNAQVYAAVDDVQSELLKMKPEVGADGGASFNELRAVNPDVCAWLTVDNTKIDYPILQGEDNITYVNTDVYGDFALAGSIFLDSNCDNTFHGKYSLLYGHHMADRKMFGDLELYTEQKFFDENTTGTLILPDRSYKLKIFACLRVSAAEEAIFIPQKWQEDNSGLIDFVRSNAMYVHQDILEHIGTSEDFSQVLAMSTCSSEFTDARTVILAVMQADLPEK